MNPILKWLETKFSRHSATVEVDEWRPPVEVRVDRAENAEDEYTVEVDCSGEYQNRAANDSQVKDIPMPDIYENDDTVVQRQLNVLNKSLLDTTQTEGFDPYNTGRHETSKVWKSSSSK